MCVHSFKKTRGTFILHHEPLQEKCCPSTNAALFFFQNKFEWYSNFEWMIGWMISVSQPLCALLSLFSRDITPYNRCTAVASGIVYGRDTFVEIQTVTFDIPGLEGQLEAWLHTFCYGWGHRWLVFDVEHKLRHYILSCLTLSHCFITEWSKPAKFSSFSVFSVVLITFMRRWTWNTKL